MAEPPAGPNRFVPEHLDQADIVLPDGTTVSMADYLEQQTKAKRRPADNKPVHVHIHRHKP